MAKSVNQKLKLFYILQMLMENTDEEHVLSTQEIIEKLAANDIKAERKTIYDDMACLQDFGYDIIQKKGKVGSGYYLAGRDFELAELKLLVDAVQASRFMTAKKSRELIKKLEKLASKHQAGQLQRQVYVSGRVKTENERIYYNVDTLYKAISENVKISFTYLEWSLSKELKPRKAGEKYLVSPWALIWDDENYYLAAYDEEADMLKHYRVDKMGGVTLTKKERAGREQFEKVGLAEYTKRTFGMYGGEEEIVTLEFSDRLIGVVMDRFGRDTEIRRTKEGRFTVRIKAAVSGQFFGWLTGLGKDVKILAPDHVKTEYLTRLQEILKEQKDV
ncbi:MAG: WYL domain-containing protein [Lachnospiraceae bacterium]|nr:WYL domain-containing protein [Lachnospiraceae bacterium]